MSRLWIFIDDVTKRWVDAYSYCSGCEMVARDLEGGNILVDVSDNMQWYDEYAHVDVWTHHLCEKGRNERKDC